MRERHSDTEDVRLDEFMFDVVQVVCRYLKTLTFDPCVIIDRYGSDQENQQDFCISHYSQSPEPTIDQQPPREAKDLTRSQPSSKTSSQNSSETSNQTSSQANSQASSQTPEQQQHQQQKKRTKPLQCRACSFKASDGDQLLEHLRSHSVSKMLLVHRVEARSRTRTRGAEPAPPTEQEEGDGEGEEGAGQATEVKGLIRCERCGYNTNRYDHYIAHLKHHSKEGQDHR